MRRAVVAIARLAGTYIREFVEHNLSVGFNKVIIADNDWKEDNEDVKEILKDYIENGFVIYEDWRDKKTNELGKNVQMYAYSLIYEKYKNDFDWFLMVDIDEFLMLENDKNVSDFLGRFPEDCEVITVNWDCKNDSGLVTYDPRPMMERFTESIPTNKCVQYANIPEDAHVKSFVKGGLPFVTWISNPHIPSNQLKVYHASGNRCDSSPFHVVDFTNARIIHFVSKTINEWCENKLKRGVADRSYELFLKTYPNRFWGYNQVTEEKIQWLREHGYSGV